MITKIDLDKNRLVKSGVITKRFVPGFGNMKETTKTFN
jgi:hypothetical protein